MKSRVLPVMFAIFLTGCASLAERGAEAYEKGLYADAAAYFERALAENPDDIEAKQGLANARTKIIDQQLIDIRMLRMASNQYQAALKLQEVLEMQGKWRTESFAAQALTQHEEMRYAEDWLRAEAKSVFTEGQPDKFRWFNYQFQRLADATRQTSKFDDYQTKLAKAGKDRCLALAKDVKGQRFFMKPMVEKYCLAWSQPVSLDVDNKDNTRYSGIEVKQQLNLNTYNNYGLRSQFGEFASELEKTFQTSPWFARNGAKSDKIVVDSTIDYRRNSTSVQREKRYVVTEKRPDPNVPNSWISVDVERVYLYPETTYIEDFSVSVGYTGNVAGQPLKERLSDNKSNRTRSHTAEFASAGLAPQPPQFLDQKKVLGGQLDTLKNRFSSDLRRLWKAQYCEQSGADLLAENVLRCAAVSPKHGMVDSWFKQTFAIDYSTMKKLYGI
ncbi:tetratricopeptide repeat protein [Veronia pacifica]|uniref:Uncharacterized protein n=1 Tax=Veronia pacifica TaxID=1080227 RepID=A0A1C3EA53_9GAMM|nr:tetratricopeptide repeat protein [Veronia pacifica]ODA30135.1 hypothetical protein A8L45_21070 [Veronia pacifica]